MFRKSSKGFLGPIGDDLPSLIPLVFALTIFFSVFTFTWNIFDSRNTGFDDNIAVLRVASILKSNSYIANHSVFEGRCEEAKSQKRLKFRAGLLPLAVERDEHFGGIDLTNLEFYEDPNDPGAIYECTNVPGEEIDYENFTVIIRFFPVALEMDYEDGGQRHFFVKPMLLVVVAW